MRFNSLKDKVVVITGASSGIGKLAAEEFLKRGARVVMAARSIDEIAYDTGFGSAPTLRHHFRRRLNTSPVAYRSHFR